jgi:hypothetical protein
VIKFWRWQYPLAGVFDTPPCRSPGADDVEPKIAGLLNGADADCEIDLDGGDILGRFRENEAYWHFPDTCRDLILEHWRTGEPLYIPVFSRIASESDDGETASFRQVFVAPFIVTAFQVGIPAGWFSNEQIGYDPNDYRRPTNGSLPCGTNELGFRCLAGYFSGDPIPVDELTGDNRIRLVG